MTSDLHLKSPDTEKIAFEKLNQKETKKVELLFYLTRAELASFSSATLKTAGETNAAFRTGERVWSEFGLCLKFYLCSTYEVL